jgi:TetR/AcrR family transcriptional regulator, cholesterol catabolism regulator
MSVDHRPSYDERLLAILQGAASVFAAKGYHRASIRDIAAATDVSLSGLYYYFSSKEELLFLIQDHCFTTLLSRLSKELDGETDPEVRLRTLVRNHLRFFVDNMEEMKVLSHESDVLTGDFGTRVLAHKREYARLVHEMLEELSPDSTPPDRAVTFSLFGMMNWIYTWYNPEKDLPVDALCEEMMHLFLNGFRTARLEAEAVPVEEHPERPSSIWRSQ